MKKTQKMEDLTAGIILDEYESLYRMAYTYVHNESDAMDIVQESAYKAMRDCRSVQNDAYLGTWLYRIVINTALEFLRKHKREDTVEEVTEPLTAAVGDYTNELAQLHSKWELEEMLEHLNNREKSVIILRFFEDCKLEDIAQITGENLNTVKARLYRALRKLRPEADQNRI